MKDQEDKRKRHGSVWVAAGLVFVGCCAIGSGIGQLTNNASAWSAIGGGVGFVLMAVVLFKRR